MAAQARSSGYTDNFICSSIWINLESIKIEGNEVHEIRHFCVDAWSLANAGTCSPSLHVSHAVRCNAPQCVTLVAVESSNCIGLKRMKAVL